MMRAPKPSLPDVRGSVGVLLAVLLQFAGPLCAQTARLPEPLRSIAELANATPPEFAADALLRIVESNKLDDKSARRELVDRAFELAAAAKFPVQMLSVPAGATDTRSGSLSQAYALKLDVISLESRAVRDMLPLDPAKARELFGRMAKPALASLTCDDSLIYLPDEFYEALTAVVNGGFTPKERAKDEHYNLLLESLAQATSPSQFPPLSRAIQNAGITPAQRQILLVRFNGLLANIQPDGRSFSASLPALFAVTSSGIEPALEKYQQKGHGCDNDTAASPQQPTASEHSPPEPSPSEPSPAAAQPAKRPGTPRLELYWQSPNSRHLLDAGKKLRFASSGEPVSDPDRATPEWQQRLDDYMNLIAGWSPDQEGSDAVYYHEKCTVYASLLDLVARDSESDRILADYVDFVSKSALYQQSPAEWFVEPQTVLDRSMNNSALHAKVLEAYRSSGNPVLSLAVALEKAFRGNLPAWAVSAK